ncbi:unnamed protein product [Rotaria socialis]|uniref:Uncharacterized protein n=1 Tax=Rotaria socialis TaxID=392032 RepID=A0A817TTC5_9BILA|nr:unnamed protein product [Rotaria socialis]
MHIHTWILFFLSLLYSSLADHYKGGSISWRPVSPYSLSSPVQVVITYRDSWALSRYACNDTTINKFLTYNDTQNATAASIICISSSAACTASNFTAISSKLYCTDFSTAFDVSTGSYYSKQNLALNSVIDIASRGASWSREQFLDFWGYRPVLAHTQFGVQSANRNFVSQKSRFLLVPDWPTVF